MSVLHSHHRTMMASSSSTSSPTPMQVHSQSPAAHSHSQSESHLHSHNLALAHHHHHSTERSIFRAAKELCRFVMTTIVVANASKCTANAASIIANYHRTAAARSSRNSNSGGKGSSSLPAKQVSDYDGVNGNVNVNVGVKENNINLWHFRTFSTCSAGSPFESSRSDLESVFASAGRSSRKGSGTGSAASARSGSHGRGGAVVTRRSRSRAVHVSRQQEQEQEQTDPYYHDGYDHHHDHDDDEPKSLEELRAQLGPVGLTIANAVEVGVSTATSYISGGIFGYVIGGAMGAPGIFRSTKTKTAHTHMGGASASGSGIKKEVQRRIGDWNSKALTAGKSWGGLSATFSGFHALARVCRGGVEDRWNGIIGSAATGAYLSRQGGPQAMLQGASTYAGFTYILDFVFGQEDGRASSERNREFEFTDTPIENRGY